ncbi:MAG: PIN domain-containing protein [Blastocatellia bacterium]|nr:PIN domain-containing protein [Blastocatellia bacterium]
MPNDSNVFVDSNILLYAASGRADDAPKAARARELLTSGQVSLSFQVLQEFYANAVSPRKLGMTPAEASAWCAAWIQFPIALLGADTFVRTLELVQRYQISNWDAAIIAAAEQLGCKKVYSEDLNHGQSYDGVYVENPFLDI